MPMLVQCALGLLVALRHAGAAHEQGGQHRARAGASLRGGKQEQYPGEMPYAYLQPMAYDCTPCTAQLPGGAGFTYVQSAVYDCSPCFASTMPMAQPAAYAVAQPVAAAGEQPAMANVVPMVQQVATVSPMGQPVANLVPMMQPMSMAQPVQVLPVAIVSDSSTQAAVPVDLVPGPFANSNDVASEPEGSTPTNDQDDATVTNAMAGDLLGSTNASTSEAAPLAEVTTSASQAWNDTTLEDVDSMNVSVIDVEMPSQAAENEDTRREQGTYDLEDARTQDLGARNASLPTGTNVSVSTVDVPLVEDASLQPEAWPPAVEAVAAAPNQSGAIPPPSTLREQVQAMEEAARELAAPPAPGMAKPAAYPAQQFAPPLPETSTPAYMGARDADAQPGGASDNHCMVCSAQFLAKQGCQALFSHVDVASLVAPECDVCSGRLWDMCNTAAAHLQQQALADATAFLGAAPRV